jgi:hypothetical protein
MLDFTTNTLILSEIVLKGKPKNLLDLQSDQILSVLRIRDI